MRSKSCLQKGILDNIESHAAATPNRAAVIFNEERLTFAELVGAYRGLARYFRDLGLRPGCRICVLAPNRPEYYFLYFATLRCGGTFFPINAELSKHEIEYIVSRTKPDLLIVDNALLANRTPIDENALRAAKRLESLDEVVSSARLGTDASLDFPSRTADDIALVIHTSGTTSRAKGVMASDRMEVLSAQALQEVWKLEATDISVCALPLSYMFGLFTASYNPLSSGACVLLLDRFNPVEVLHAIEKHRATFMVGVPTKFAMMINHVRETGKRYDLSSMRFFAASGAPALDKTKKDFKTYLGHDLLDYYALSECTPIFSFDMRGGRLATGSSGKLVAGARVKVLDEDGNLLPADTIGRLSISSERLTPGYFEDPSKTEEAIQDGWFATGDLVREADDGCYSILGRTRDQVISGGYKIAVTEIEDVLLRHPAVASAAVLGEADETLGEIIVAVVVLHTPGMVSAEGIQQFCAEHLAQYKIPRKVRFRSELPVSPAGKILKREL